MATATARKNPFGTTSKAAFDKDNEGSSYIKLPEGETALRIMPPSEERNGEMPHVKFYCHFQVGLENKTFICPLKSGLRSSCYLCKMAAKITDEQERKDASAKQRYIMNVWNPEQPDKGIQFYECGYTIKNTLAGFYNRHGDYTHFETGYLIIFTRTGTGLKSKYGLAPDRDADPISDNIIKWIDKNGFPDLMSRITDPGDAAMKAALSYEDEPQTEEDLEDMADEDAQDLAAEAAEDEEDEDGEEGDGVPFAEAAEEEAPARRRFGTGPRGAAAAAPVRRSSAAAPRQLAASSGGTRRRSA